MLGIIFLPEIILILSAVIPACFLMKKVYQLDHVEPESPRMIGPLILWGILSTISALILEEIGGLLLNSLLPEESLLYNIILYFGIVAFAEEGSKLVVLRKRTWNDPEFNCQFDGIVYAVTISLGFALWENISYVLNYGLYTALIRAITAVPGHACFGVFMGVWYGRTKRCHNNGFTAGEKICKVLTFLIPVIIHGSYDFICTYEAATKYGSLFFLCFIIILFLVARKTVVKESQKDWFI